jgi:hypothetical protein
MKIINQKLKNGLLMLLCSAAFMSGCKKGTFDINNTNPNAPSTVPANYALSAALTATAGNIFGGTADFLNVWMGYWVPSGEYTPSPVYVLYQINTDNFAGNWDASYLNLENYKLIEKNASGDPSQAYYQAMSLIMQSFVYQRVVDLFNNAPYTEALQQGSNFNPAYTPAAEIYDSLIYKLDVAVDIINSGIASGIAEDPAEYDVLFGGDMEKWIKFAHTVKLKLLMRETETAGGSIKGQLSGLTTDDFLGADEDASINPGYSAGSNAQLNPLYYDVGFTATGSDGINRKYWRANSYAVDFYYDNNDPRVYNIFEVKSDGEVHGRALGTSDNDKNSSISGADGSGIVNSPSQSSYILPAFESLFLQAEAIERGYLNGDAHATFNAAVTESFRLLGVADYESAAAAYTSQSNANTNYASSSNKIKTIITQKWAACAAFDPLESYSDWRRLKIPADLPVSIYPGNTATHTPYRIPYPTSEYSYNANNANAQGNIDIMSSKIFWMP